MSIGFALRATDGLVVAADGRTSKIESGHPQTDHAVKLTAAPYDLPFVVVALGRASVNRVLVHELVAHVLADVPYEILRATSLRSVALLVGAGLRGAATVHPQAGYDIDGREFTIGFQIMVAGYGNGATACPCEVWTSTIPSTGVGLEARVENVIMCGPLTGQRPGLQPL